MALALTLLRELELAKDLYIQTHDQFVGLSHMYAGKVELWKKMDRNTRKVGGVTKSVYRHLSSKGKLIHGVQVSWLTTVDLVDSPLYGCDFSAHDCARKGN